MWTIVLIAAVGALAVGLNITLLVEKLTGNLDEGAGEANESNHGDRVADASSLRRSPSLRRAKSRHWRGWPRWRTLARWPSRVATVEWNRRRC